MKTKTIYNIVGSVGYYEDIYRYSVIATPNKERAEELKLQLEKERDALHLKVDEIYQEYYQKEHSYREKMYNMLKEAIESHITLDRYEWDCLDDRPYYIIEEIAYEEED